jgi:hypothetical protein
LMTRNELSALLDDKTFFKTKTNRKVFVCVNASSSLSSSKLFVLLLDTALFAFFCFFVGDQNCYIQVFENLCFFFLSMLCDAHVSASTSDATRNDSKYRQFVCRKHLCNHKPTTPYMEAGRPAQRVAASCRSNSRLALRRRWPTTLAAVLDSCLRQCH